MNDIVNEQWLNDADDYLCYTVDTNNLDKTFYKEFTYILESSR